MKSLGLYIIVLLTVFGPTFYPGFGFPSIHIEDIILLPVALALPFFGGRSLGGLLFPRHLRKLTIPYFLILFYVLLLTVLLIPMFPSYLISTSMFVALGRFKPLFLVFVAYAILSERQQTQRLGSLLILLLIAEFALMVCQRSNLLGVNDWLSPMYTISELRGTYVAGYRVFGTFGNPNTMGTAMSIFGTLAFARMIYGPGKVFRLVAGLAVAMALVACIWLSKTRQGTACLLAGCFLVQMVAIFRSGRRGWGSVSMVLGVVALVFAMAYLQTDVELAERFGVFTGQRGLTEESSVGWRLSLWGSFIGAQGGWLLTGQGMSGFVVSEAIWGWDSGYLSTIVYGGLPGLAGLLYLMLAPVLAAWKRIGMVGGQHPDTWLHVGCVGIVAPLLLANVVNNTLSVSRVMSVVVLIYGLSFAAMKIEDAESEWSQAYGESLETGAYEMAY